MDCVLICSHVPLFSFGILSYYVGCSDCEINGVLGFYLELTTQKNKFSADKVDELMEEFLLYFQTKLEAYTEDEYQKYVRKIYTKADWWFCLPTEVRPEKMRCLVIFLSNGVLL